MAAVMKRQRADIERGAVVGVARHFGFMAQVIVKVSGCNELRFCDSEQEAIGWLLNG